MEGKNGGTLKPFEKGESGNPNGRPKGAKNRSTIAKYWLEVNQNLKNPLTGESETIDFVNDCINTTLKNKHKTLQ